MPVGRIVKELLFAMSQWIFLAGGADGWHPDV